MSNPEAGTRQAKDAGAVDDRGTSQDEARTILKKLRDQGFDSSDEQFAVALGRPVEEVKGWIEGTEPVDDDIIMKARGIAQQRGIEIE
jgi:hypothetical protein